MVLKVGTGNEKREIGNEEMEMVVVVASWQYRGRCHMVYQNVGCKGFVCQNYRYYHRSLVVTMK